MIRDVATAAFATILVDTPLNRCLIRLCPMLAAKQQRSYYIHAILFEEQEQDEYLGEAFFPLPLSLSLSPPFPVLRRKNYYHFDFGSVFIFIGNRRVVNVFDYSLYTPMIPWLHGSMRT